MKHEDFAFLYELEEDLWWFAGMREITAVLLDGFDSAYDLQICLWGQINRKLLSEISFTKIGKIKLLPDECPKVRRKSNKFNDHF